MRRRLTQILLALALVAGLGGVRQAFAQAAYGYSGIVFNGASENLYSYSMTDLDYVAQAYYGVLTDAYLYAGNTIVASSEGATVGGYVYLYYPTAINSSYWIQTNHWVYPSAPGPGMPSFSCITPEWYLGSFGVGACNTGSPGMTYIGTSYASGNTDGSAPSITGLDQTTYGTAQTGTSGYVIVYGSNLTNLDFGNTTVSIGDGISTSLTYVSQGQLNVYYTIPGGATPGAQTLTVTTPYGSTSATFQVYPISITTTSVNGGLQGYAYGWNFWASGGQPPYSWSVAPGSALPPGLSLTTTIGSYGTLSGTPTTASNAFTFTVQVTDSLGATATHTYTMAVQGFALGPLGPGITGVAGGFDITVPIPVTWTLDFNYAALQAAGGYLFGNCGSSGPDVTLSYSFGGLYALFNTGLYSGSFTCEIGAVIGAVEIIVQIPFNVAPTITNVSLQPFVAGETYQNVVVSGIGFGTGCPTAAISGAGAGQNPQFTVYPANCSATSVEGTVTITDRHATGPNGTLTLTWPGLTPATYTLAIVPVQMSLTQVGTTAISTDGKYSEDTTISVTAVRADTGATITDFSDTVNIAEDTTVGNYVFIYTQNGGSLPPSVTIAPGMDGTTSFVAKSLAGPGRVAGSTPNPALLTTPGYPVYGGEDLSIPQWVYSQNFDPMSRGIVFDWVQARVRDVFAAAKAAGGDYGSVMATVSTYYIQYLVNSQGVAYGGQTNWVPGGSATSSVTLNPYFNNYRIGAPGQTTCGNSDGTNSFTNAVIHEARHAYQSSLVALPGNDQDHDFLITNIAPISPAAVFQDTAVVRKGCDEFANSPTDIGYNGPTIFDQNAVAAYAWEEDAWEFAARFAPCGSATLPRFYKEQRIMRPILPVLVLSLFAGTIWATSPAPFNSGLVQVDRIAAASSVGTASAVFQLLCEIVGGTVASASPDLVRTAGTGAIDASLLHEPEVRAYAAQKIGDLGSDEAIAYLKALHTEDLPADRNYTIYAAVQIAYRRALLSREPDPNLQRAFLEDLLQRRSDQWVNGEIFSWALSELCDRGSVASMPIIEKALEKGDRRSNIELIRGCEAEMTIVNSDPDRVKALGAALDRLTREQTGTSLDRQLLIWATGQLSRDNSKEAQAELRRFAANALGLKGDSPAVQELKGLARAYARQ